MRSVLALTVFLPSVAGAQTLALEEDFSCFDTAFYGTNTAASRFLSVYALDEWATDFNAGVSPKTDNGAGSFGTPVDAYENFLLTGHPRARVREPSSRSCTHCPIRYLRPPSAAARCAARISRFTATVS